MSDSHGPTPGDTPRTLDAMQRRVLGVLIEKAKITPGSYPMTVNAVVSGCNQKSNRDPLTTFDDADVENTLNQLIDLGVVELIDWVGRVPKYKHLAYDWLSVGRGDLAVLGELLQSGLMLELTPPGRGQIVTHNLYTREELEEVRASVSGGGFRFRCRASRARRVGRSPRPSLRAVVHLHETRSTGTTRIEVIDQSNRVHGSVLAEEFVDLGLGGAERQVAYM
jgi:uncharacterized protein YceH (UPF0502 family)